MTTHLFQINADLEEDGGIEKTFVESDEFGNPLLGQTKLSVLSNFIHGYCSIGLGFDIFEKRDNLGSLDEVFIFGWRTEMDEEASKSHVRIYSQIRIFLILAQSLELPCHLRTTLRYSNRLSCVAVTDSPHMLLYHLLLSESRMQLLHQFNS